MFRRTIRRFRPRFRRGVRRGAFRKAVSFQRLSRLIVPERAIVRLPYYDAFNLDFTSADYGVTQWHRFRINSIFDPDFEIGGHQPGGHDQLAQFYGKYRVYSMHYVFEASLGIEGATEANNETVADMMVSHSSENNFIGTTISSRAETSPFRHWKTCQMGQFPARIKGRVSPARVMGVSNEDYRVDDTNEADFGADPAFTPLTAFGANLRFSPGTSTVRMRVTVFLVFTVGVFDRLNIALS